MLASHVPIQISSLYYHSLNNNEQNTLTVIVTGERSRQSGLVVPAKLLFQTSNRKSAATLETEFAKRKNLFPTVTLKFREKEIYRKFPFYTAAYCNKKQIQN